MMPPTTLTESERCAVWHLIQAAKHPDLYENDLEDKRLAILRLLRDVRSKFIISVELKCEELGQIPRAF